MGGQAHEGRPGDPVVLYKAEFLPSVRYHGGQPWNKDKGFSVWRYPVPVDAPEEGREYFSFGTWKVGKIKIGEVGVLG